MPSASWLRKNSVAPVPTRAELAWNQAARHRGAQRFEADLRGARSRFRAVLEADPRAKAGGQQRHHAGGQIQRARADAAGLRRGHFAVVIQPAQAEYATQQHRDRQDDHGIGAQRQPQQLEHQLRGDLAIGRATQHEGQLVGQQQHQQDDGHRDRGQRDLAQHMAEEDSAHYHGASARRLNR